MAGLTRFRIEGQGKHKETLSQHLHLIAQNVISADNGHLMKRDSRWECTQDVITGAPGNYKGRVVYKFKGDDDAS